MIGGAGMQVVGLIYLNVTMAFQIVSFLLLLAFLNKKLFRPMLEYLDKRAAGIQQELDEAQATKAEAQTDRQAARDELDEARRESYAIRSESREIAGGERERILERAKGEAAHVVEQAQREIEQSAEVARAALREEAGTLAIRVAEKVLRGELTEAQKRKVTTVYVDETEGLSD